MNQATVAVSNSPAGLEPKVVELQGEILALNHKLAAEALRADQGWARYEALRVALAERNSARMTMANGTGDVGIPNGYSRVDFTCRTPMAPCPTCGSVNSVEMHATNYPGERFIVCNFNEEGCGTRTAGGDSEAEAIANWERRA